MKQLSFLCTLILTSAIGFSQEVWEAPKEASIIQSPIDLLNTKTIRAGEKLFGTACWSCHGEYGEGDGVAAEGLEVAPSDLSSSTIQQQTDGDFFWKVSTGRGQMAGYKESLSEEERWQLVAFIRSLANSNEP